MVQAILLRIKQVDKDDEKDLHYMRIGRGIKKATMFRFTEAKEENSDKNLVLARIRGVSSHFQFL